MEHKNRTRVSKQSLIQELYIIKHSYPYIKNGWKWRRHQEYELQNTKFYVDWMMFDPEGNPYICFFNINGDLTVEYQMKIKKDVEIFNKLYIKFRQDGAKVNWMIFNKDGRI